MSAVGILSFFGLVMLLGWLLYRKDLREHRPTARMMKIRSNLTVDEEEEGLTDDQDPDWADEHLRYWFAHDEHCLGLKFASTQIPIGQWEGTYLGDLRHSQLEALWNYRDNLGDYPGFVTQLRHWNKIQPEDLMYPKMDLEQPEERDEA